jgi:hypothetical protein
MPSRRAASDRLPPQSKKMVITNWRMASSSVAVIGM